MHHDAPQEVPAPVQPVSIHHFTQRTDVHVEQIETPAPVAPVAAPAPAKSATPPAETEFEFSDTTSLICLLCARQFKSIDQLKRHNKESDLHKVNRSQYGLFTDSPNKRVRKTTRTLHCARLPARRCAPHGPRQIKPSNPNTATVRQSGVSCTISQTFHDLSQASGRNPNGSQKGLGPRHLRSRRRSTRGRTTIMLATSC